jgi:mycoredoxin
MADKIVVYGKPTCAMVVPVRLILEQANAQYEYIDILADAEAKARVREINHGLESVPTLEFPDGSTMTEPTGGDVRQKLQALGYEFASPSLTQRMMALLANPLATYAALLLVVAGALSGNNLLAAVGVVVLVLRFATHLLWTRSSHATKYET